MHDFSLSSKKKKRKKEKIFKNNASGFTYCVKISLQWGGYIRTSNKRDGSSEERSRQTIKTDPIYIYMDLHWACVLAIGPSLSQFLLFVGML